MVRLKIGITSTVSRLVHYLLTRSLIPSAIPDPRGTRPPAKSHVKSCGVRPKVGGSGPPRPPSGCARGWSLSSELHLMRYGSWIWSCLSPGDMRKVCRSCIGPVNITNDWIIGYIPFYMSLNVIQYSSN